MHVGRAPSSCTMSGNNPENQIEEVKIKFGQSMDNKNKEIIQYTHTHISPRSSIQDCTSLTEITQHTSTDQFMKYTDIINVGHESSAGRSDAHINRHIKIKLKMLTLHSDPQLSMSLYRHEEEPYGHLCAPE